MHPFVPSVLLRVARRNPFRQWRMRCRICAHIAAELAERAREIFDEAVQLGDDAAIGVETQADISAYVTTQANLSAGASIAKAAARRRLLAVAQELSEASTTAGTRTAMPVMSASSCIQSGLRAAPPQATPCGGP